MDSEKTKKGTLLYFLLGMAAGAGAVLLLASGLGRERETYELEENAVARTKGLRGQINWARDRFEFEHETVAALPGEDEPDVSGDALPGEDEPDVSGDALSGDDELDVS